MKLFLVFLNRHQIASTWSSNWPLQHMPIVIRWEDKAYQNSTFFRFFLTIFLKYLYFEWFFWEVTLTIINVFQHARHFVLSSTRVKSQPFWRKSKKLEKMSKIMTFCKKLTSVTFDFSGFLNTPDSARQKSPSGQGTKININGIFLQKNEKKSFLTPPTCQKGQQRVIQAQRSLKDFWFSRQIMAACKNSALFNVPVPRSRVEMHPLYLLFFRAAEAPTPA